MKIGPVCKTVELIKRESFEYKIVDDLEQIKISSQYFKDGYGLMVNMHPKCWHC